MNLLPPLTVSENLAASSAALAAMRKQGITSFLDAWTDPETMTAFTDLHKQGKLTARAHFAVLIDLDKGATPQSAVAELLKQQKQFDQGPTVVRAIDAGAPRQTVHGRRDRRAGLHRRHAGALPGQQGDSGKARLAARRRATAPSYFPADALKTTLAELAVGGIDPHIHVDGDRAVRETLDAIEALRATAAGKPCGRRWRTTKSSRRPTIRASPSWM
jgi:predicted amidohydrolase YtcJ